MIKVLKRTGWIYYKLMGPLGSKSVSYLGLVTCTPIFSFITHYLFLAQNICPFFLVLYNTDKVRKLEIS
jgi:hypothetical protein